MIVTSGCTGGSHKASPNPSETSAAATRADAADLVVAPGQPVSQLALDANFVGYIHGVGGATQFNQLSIRSRSGAYPVVLERTGSYPNGGIYNLAIGSGWAVWTETSEIVTAQNGDVQWSVVAANLKTKAQRVIATSIDATLAPKAVLGNGTIAFGVRPHDRTISTPGSRPDPIEYVRLDSIETVHTLTSSVQFDPLTIATAKDGLYLAIIEQGQQGLDLLPFAGAQRALYRGPLQIAAISEGTFGATDPAQDSEDGSAGVSQNLTICAVQCVKPVTLVKGPGVSEQVLGTQIVTFSGDRTADATAIAAGDITVVSDTGAHIDALKVGALDYAGWAVSGMTVAWTEPSTQDASTRSERIHLRTYTLVR